MKTRQSRPRTYLAGLLLAPLFLAAGPAPFPAAPPQDAAQADEVILAEGEWVKDQVNGTWIYRSEDGATMVRARYKKGRRTGAYRVYFPSGELRAEVKFKKDEATGPWTVYDEEGDRLEAWCGEYEAVHEHWANDQTRVLGQNLDGVPHGRWQFNWPDGSHWLTAWFEHGEPVDQWQHSHLDGTPDKDFYAEVWGPSRDSSALHEMPWALLTADLKIAPGEQAKHLDLLVAPAPKVHAADSLAKLAADLFAQSGASISTEQTLLYLEPTLWPELSAFDLPSLLTELLEIDASSDLESLNRGLQGPLVGIFQGVPLTPKDAKPEEARQALRRAISIWGLTRSDLSWWKLQLPMAAKTRVAESLYLRPIPSFTSVTRKASFPPAFQGRIETVFSRDKDRDEVSRTLIGKGLDWLADNQNSRGSWDTLNGHDAGVTGLAILAFLGDGSTATAGPWSEHIRKAASFLCARLDPKAGTLYPTTPNYIRAYDHIICNLALAELYAVSPSEGLAEAIRIATKVTLGYRQENSGWGYEIGGMGLKADTSITGWAVHTLLVLRATGLELSDEDDKAEMDKALAAGLRFFSRLRDLESGRVGYNAPGQRSARVTDVNDHYLAKKGEALTSVALYMHALAEALLPDEFTLFSAGQRNTSVDLLLKRLPAWEPDRFSCDMYYWYFGSQAMFWQGGKDWESWQTALVDTALEGQADDGTWPSVGPWGLRQGTAYSTAMMVLSLQAPGRYTAVEKSPRRK